MFHIFSFEVKIIMANRLCKSKLLNDNQRKALCNILHLALTEIRQLGYSGNAEQAADLADTFHNLPQKIWSEHFNITYFREGFLLLYYRKWPDKRCDYLVLLNEAEELT
jgi:galactose-1-phosphate uridylyltransferase